MSTLSNQSVLSEAVDLKAQTPTPTSQFSLNIHGKQVISILGTVVLCLVILNLLTRIPLALAGDRVGGGILEIAYRFDLDRENTIGSWYSSLTLFLSAVLLGIIAKVNYARRDKYALHWAFLACGFLAMSLDESAAIHEISMVPLRRILNLKGYFYFAWIVPGVIAVTLISLAYVRFLLALKRSTRLRFILSAAIFLTGAVGLEAVGGMLVESEGFQSLTYIFVSTLEESCEMLGVLIFIHALCEHLGTLTRSLRLEFN